jgi:formiminoglutamase
VTQQKKEDPLWPRAVTLLTTNQDAPVALIGVPAHKTSISPTNADTTPTAVRTALSKYSTYNATHDIDVRSISVFDAQDIHSPDFPEGEARVFERMAALRGKLVIAIGGDNSITYAVARGLWGEAINRAGLVTVDAHHDLRDGSSNGSPVKRLLDAGLPGTNIAQLGIADFSNSPQYSQRAKDAGIYVTTRSAFRTLTPEVIVENALRVAGADGGPIHVDIDLDVCDRAVVPGCPAAAPGGISADQLRQLCFHFGTDSRVTSIDFTEVDASVDSADGRTVRLVALCVLEFLAGVALR